MLPPHKRLAVIFDFDETLTDDSTSALLRSCGLSETEVANLWDVAVPGLYDRGFDPTEAYLMLLVKEVMKREKLEVLRDRNLRKFGSTLAFHEGIPELFDEVRKLVSGRMQVQFFVISGGLQEVIAGSPLGNPGLLDDFWGCTLHWDKLLTVPYPKNVISFTEKTRYIFQINKGLIGAKYKNKPHAVNEHMSPLSRHVPLKNMIYIGDGLTDVPCFSILENGKGYPICVYNKAHKRREGIQKSIKATRHRGVHGPYRANYTKDTSLYDCIESRIEELVAAS